MVPRAVLMKSGLKPFNTARTANSAHPKSIIFSAKPMSRFSKSAQSTVRRPYQSKTVLSNKRFTQTNNTAKAKVVNTARPHSAVVNAVRVNQANAVKASACWVWRPTKLDSASITLKKHNYINARGRSNGCSRHMTGNIAYLSDFKEFDGGYVAFREGAHGGRISAKCVAAASCYRQVLWIQNQLLDYGYNFINTVINIDNNNLLTKVFDPGRHVKRGRDTKISQSSGPPAKVGDEAVHKELADRMERAAATASSLEVEQDSDAQTRFETTSKQSNDPPISRVNTLGSGEDSMKRLELMELCTKLSDLVSEKKREMLKRASEKNWLMIEVLFGMKLKLMLDVGNGEPKSAADDQKQVEESEDDSSPKEVNDAVQHVNTASPEVNTGHFKLNIVDPSVNTASSYELDSPKDMFKLGASHTLETTHVEFFSDEDEPEVDLGNITNSYTVPTTPNTRIHKDHPIKNVIGDVKSSIQTRRMTKSTSEQGFLNAVYMFAPKILSKFYLSHVKRGQDTKIPQSSGPPVKVSDEVVHKELGDRMEKAATTASSLEAEQDSGNINRTQSMATLNEPSP
ncbi:hypothetical protein Tco_0958798 [Tanacetum coccineum]